MLTRSQINKLRPGDSVLYHSKTGVLRVQVITNDEDNLIISDGGSGQVQFPHHNGLLDLPEDYVEPR